MRCALPLAALLVTVLMQTLHAEPSIDKTDAGFVTTGLPYTAVVGDNGMLNSIKVGDVELLALVDEAGMRLGPAGEPVEITGTKHQANRVYAFGPKVLLEYVFEPDGFYLHLRKNGIPDGHQIKLYLSDAFTRLRNPHYGDEYDINSKSVGGNLRPLTAKGTGLDFTGAQLARYDDRVEVAPGWVTNAETAFRVGVITTPSLEDAFVVGAASPHEDWQYDGSPSTMTTTIRLGDKAASFNGKAELRIVDYATGATQAKQTQALKIASGAAATLEWQLADLPPGVKHAEIHAIEGRDPFTAAARIAAPRFAWNVKSIERDVEPLDFDQFWKGTLAAQKKIPVDLRLEKVRDEGKSELYKFSFQGLLGHRAYGWLCVPKDKSKKVPAVLQLPSSGLRPFHPLIFPEGDKVGMSISINTQPIDKPWDWYDWATWPAPYLSNGIMDRDRYWLRYSYAACVRAAEILAAREEVDADNILAYGSSQGGGLTLVVAGLWPHFKAAVANVPALCRLDWNLNHIKPAYFPIGTTKETHKSVERTLRYFDATHFAARIECPVWISVGLRDDVTPAVGALCAYAAVPHDRKTLNISPAGGHGGGFGIGSASSVWPGQ